ncbi:galactose mutarotase-like protein [Trametes elegans]|nr:galactose mutarotase-like protein [Trametes elegans]
MQTPSRMLVVASGIALFPWLLVGVSGAAIASGTEQPSTAAAFDSISSPAPSSFAIDASFTSAPPSASLLSSDAVSLTSSEVAVSSSVPASSESSSTAPTSASSSATSSLSSSSSISPSSTSSGTSQPTQTVDAGTAVDIGSVRERRLSIILSSIASTDLSSVPDWLNSLGSDGKWPDSEVDYTTGCDGRRANWPAQDHWGHIVAMAAVWHGGAANSSNELANSTELLDGIHRAMDYWFTNDYTNEACLEWGGKDQCPCGTPGWWNTNWFPNIIRIPDLVTQGCLLMGVESLTGSQIAHCKLNGDRSYGTFDRFVNGLGYLTGANLLDVAKIGITSGLLTDNATLIADGFERIHKEVVIQDALQSDGIRRDGSFGQHRGIIYNGNYGKDYATDVLALEIAAANTQYSASNSSTGSQQAFETLLDGDIWMIYRNIKTNVLHWDFSVLNRFISFPVSDGQATSSILLNVPQIETLGELWDSSVLQTVHETLTKQDTTANAGSIKGNRMFYANDYMVHRGSRYVTTLKMYSKRTKNGECTNSQNPFGFHLADGTLYTYLEGDEYEDIAAAWDWNLIPGTTNDYNATPLTCATTNNAGKERFVGGASTGTVGAAAMRYTNPLTGSLKFQKAWFFLDDDVQHVMISNVNSSTSKPVVSVLDQKRLNGKVYVDGIPLSHGGNFTFARSLWHDNVGYTFEHSLFDSRFKLAVDFGARSGDWASIGISTVGNITVDLFSAWLNHGSGSELDVPIAYTAFPALSHAEFLLKSLTTRLTTIQNDASVSAVYDQKHRTAYYVFWDVAGGSAKFSPSLFEAPVTVQASGNSIVIYNLEKKTLTVSDPSQTLGAIQVTINGGQPVNVALPSGGTAGNSVTTTL